MQATTLRWALGLAASGVLLGTPADAQDPVHAHIGHAADSFGDTPNGQGLLPAAVAEAEVAAQHAVLAAEDPTNLDGMRRHAGHVLHALDPSVVASGPGLGYGVREATRGAALHVELAAGADSISENVSFHGHHITVALGDVVQWTDEAIALGQRIQSAASVADAASLVARLNTLCQEIALGRDANGDGRIGWQEGEGGLAQATQHMTLMKRGEGLSR